MKYKYIVGLLVALNFNNMFASDVEDAKYARTYAALTSGAGTAVANVNAALAGNENFNHDLDINIARGCSAGFELRKAVIGLSPQHLKDVVNAHGAFFQTSLGMSLVYGWALNKCDKVVTPYYIGRYFSFDKLFQGLAEKVGASYGSQTKTLLSKTFKSGLTAVEVTEEARWAFYHHLMYLPYAIEQVRAAAPLAAVSLLAPVVPPSMDALIAGARRTKAEAVAEAAAVQDEILLAQMIVKGKSLLRGTYEEYIAPFINKNLTELRLYEEQKAAAQESQTRRNAKILLVIEGLKADTPSRQEALDNALAIISDWNFMSAICEISEEVFPKFVDSTDFLLLQQMVRMHLPNVMNNQHHVDKVLALTKEDALTGENIAEKRNSIAWVLFHLKFKFDLFP